jgi:hypothetical protein
MVPLSRKVIEHKIWVAIFSTAVVSNYFFTLRRTERDVIKNVLIFIQSTLYWSSKKVPSTDLYKSTLYWPSYTVPSIDLHTKYPLLIFIKSTLYWSSYKAPSIDLHTKYPLFLSDFNETFNFSTVFRKVHKYKISYKSVAWEASRSMRTNRRTGERTDVTKLIVAFRNFANAPKNQAVNAV